MCGICGIVKFDETHVSGIDLQMMIDKMKHRGPDDEGVFAEDNIGLGNVRLSIIDLSSAGHQPMFSEDGRFVLTYNGEIYNYIELRNKLKGKYNFKTRTDTEVLLNAYIEWGADSMNFLNGMFAFAVYDRRKKTLFCCRDRFGVKPFYYYKDQYQFIFSSEIKPILTMVRQSGVDEKSVFEYLVFNRTDQTESTFFKNIKKLQHSHTIIIKDNGIKLHRWYDLKNNIEEEFSGADEYKEIFSSSVSLRLRSDVPVGVCLSGGLDSSSITSTLINEFKLNDVNTFSAIYGENVREDESDFINEYRDQIRNMHFTYPSADTLYEDMESFVLAQEEPVPTTSPYAQFKVMELASKFVKVTLDGQGADESLAGYHYFFGLYFKDLLLNFQLLRLASELFSYYRKHRSVYAYKTFIYFLLPAVFKTNLRIREKGYISKEFMKEDPLENNVIANVLYNSKSLKESLLNHFEHKLEHLLKWEDKNSMWFSIESRIPFLDYRLVERTLALSSCQIIRGGMTKHILRESMKGVLPEKIRLRKDKIGFGTPEDEWFRSKKFIVFINDVLSSSDFINMNFIDVKEARKLFDKHVKREKNVSQEIWKWINLYLWTKNFFDNSKKKIQSNTRSITRIVN